MSLQDSQSLGYWADWMRCHNVIENVGKENLPVKIMSINQSLWKCRFGKIIN